MGISDAVRKIHNSDNQKASAAVREDAKKQKSVSEKAMGSFRHAFQQSDCTHMPTKAREWFPASQLSRINVRAFVFDYFFPGEAIKWKLNNFLMAEAGTAIHKTFQNKILGPSQLLYGEWINPSGEVHFGLMPDGLNDDWDYLEPSFTCEKYRVRGRCDGVVPVPGWDMQEWPLLEIKTTSSDAFSKIKGTGLVPDYYRAQAAFYLYACGRKRTWFLMVNRDTMTTHMLEYLYNPKDWDAVKYQVCDVWKHIQAKTMPRKEWDNLDERSSLAGEWIDEHLQASEIEPTEAIQKWVDPRCIQL